MLYAYLVMTTLLLILTVTHGFVVVAPTSLSRQASFLSLDDGSVSLEEESSSSTTTKTTTTTTSSSTATPTNNNMEIRQPDILDPFLPAADPNYAIRGPVGDKDFVLERSGGPTEEELKSENIIKIVRVECSDLEVNTLMWKCLGYRFHQDKEEWVPECVFPKWLERYPTPPDFIGMRRIYSKEIDQPSLKANQAIVRSIPVEFKQSLKTHLKPLGFTGYQYSELTPNKTRRAQCANWLLYYREQLFGYTLEELQERKRSRLQAQADSTEWSPPVTEVV